MGQFKTFAAGFDLHGDMHDKDAQTAFLRFVKDFAPDVRIMGGDLFDFRAFRKKASESEKTDSIDKDYLCGERFMSAFKPHVWLWGNHDDRLNDLASNKNEAIRQCGIGLLTDVKALAKGLGTVCLPYDSDLGVYQINGVGPKFIHGGYANQGGETHLKAHAMVYGSCIVGHDHAQGIVPVCRHGEHAYAYGAGSLCKISMPYNARGKMKLRQANGWAYGVVNTQTGEACVYLARKLDDKWVHPMDFKL